MKWKKIGDILVLDKYDDSANFEQLAKMHNVKSIIKIDRIHGQKREPKMELLYGSETETINKENKCLFKLDLSKVMWSKGNNNERIRIAGLVEENETVIDMFAGIGYFSIPIGKFSNAKEIISTEINPNSFHFLKENIRLNKIGNITPILGDNRDIVPNYSADRIIMGYVKTTHHFLDVAIGSLNKNGIIHYHETVPDKLIETRPIKRVREAANGRSVELLNIQKIKRYAPGVMHIVADVQFD
ncbi:MAG: class I SAM-dependent methyltransferase family protein [Methanobrevibacter sp.]|uniref:class I SAM-dependent methyltransferase n=1 Tax=Methanobrevibacter sp. TaxID=66852 RepID=UPI0026DFD7DC|nr:class I SAM-dependent methyltransferase family protein [Methanobrevibacter sp.]MDO5848109.1 class I SAM-dependent methyltransferase family protein [Methanobrevibacter sp.]